MIVNIMRGGPGLGNIAPAQSDYFQATRGGGHGDYRHIVLAPSSVQEIIDLMGLAFDLADRYRNPVMVVGDGILGQMMEPVELKEEEPPVPPAKPWATTGMRGRGHPNIINSLYIVPEELEAVNRRLAVKYARMEEDEQRWDAYRVDDAAVVVVAYGTMARIARAAVDMARARGVATGLIRPITLWPFPRRAFAHISPGVLCFLVVEMSAGQMVDDVRLAVNGARPVHFYGRTGGVVPTVREVAEAITRVAGGEAGGQDLCSAAGAHG